MDAYDEAVASLKGKDKVKIRQIWGDHKIHAAGILFGIVHPDRNIDSNKYGCLTQIRQDAAAGYTCTEPWIGYTPELTEAISQDERIPTNIDTVDDYEVFAEWQRRIDIELNRTPPEWRGEEE